MNPSTAFATVLADELARCGVREVVVAPGSRSTPLAMAFYELDLASRVRLHVRIDERSASFTALGLAKASRRPVAVVCTSGTAAANFHPAVIEASESAVPLLVLTADRPPELRGTGASQTIDQVKLYGSAVRWYAEAGVPERLPGMVGYWRSLACRAWAHAAGAIGTLPGPVHLNLPFRDPLVPDVPAASTPGAGQPGPPAPGSPGAGGPAAGVSRPGLPGGTDWPERLDGRPGGAPWTRFVPPGAAGPSCGEDSAGPHAAAADSLSAQPLPALTLPWTKRGVLVCGDGDYDAAALVELAERAGWPVLAEPSSGARRGPNALTGYQYLLASREFMAACRPDVIVSAGRPGLSRPQTALLALARSAGSGNAGPPGTATAGAGQAPEDDGTRRAVRHVVIGQGPGLWADPQRAATDVAAAVELTGIPAPGTGQDWLDAWLGADAAATRAAGEVLGSRPAGPAAGQYDPAIPRRAQPAPGLSEPEVARELLAALPEAALLWCGNSLSVRDIDLLLPPRADVRVLASRGVSGIDGTASTAIGAALAHAADCPGAVAFALIGDLSLLHDAPGLVIGPGEPRPDLCLVVVNNDGGAIFEGLEPAAFAGPGPAEAGEPGLSVFERMFGTPHGASLERLAAAFGIPYALAEQPGDLAKAAAATVPGSGLRIVEARTGRAANAELRARMRAAAVSAAAAAARDAGFA